MPPIVDTAAFVSCPKGAAASSAELLPQPGRVEAQHGGPGPGPFLAGSSRSKSQLDLPLVGSVTVHRTINPLSVTGGDLTLRSPVDSYDGHEAIDQQRSSPRSVTNATSRWEGPVLFVEDCKDVCPTEFFAGVDVRNDLCFFDVFCILMAHWWSFSGKGLASSVKVSTCLYTLKIPPRCKHPTGRNAVPWKYWWLLDPSDVDDIEGCKNTTPLLHKSSTPDSNVSFHAVSLFSNDSDIQRMAPFLGDKPSLSDADRCPRMSWLYIPSSAVGSRRASKAPG